MKQSIDRAILLFGLAGAHTPILIAQLVNEKPLRIRRVQGYVTDEVGKAVSEAKVQLLRDGKPVLEMTAGKAGWFQIEGASGKYVLVASSGVTQAVKFWLERTSFATNSLRDGMDQRSLHGLLHLGLHQQETVLRSMAEYRTLLLGNIEKDATQK
jgi:hypothetical protein